MAHCAFPSHSITGLTNTMQVRSSFIPALTFSLLLTSSLQAQPLPDAGRILQQQTPALEQPAPSPAFEFKAPLLQPAPPGGPQVILQAVHISGNSRISSEILVTALGDYQGKAFDLAGLKGLADRITQYYQQAGYPFARAIVPAQSMSGGVLRIEVVEGRYGQIRATGDTELSAQAQAFLAPLVSGSVIESESLERTTLLLDDLPGIRTSPVIRPGEQVGTGDLLVQVDRDRRFSGEAGIDNQGNRYSGEYRVFLNGRVDSPFLLGDQLSLQSRYTDEDMWLGSLEYSLPLGVSGLRGHAGYAHTDYQLGKEFASLDARGYARVTSAGLRYPLLRSQRVNLTVGVQYQYKRLQDEYRVIDLRQDKSSDVIPLTLGFDVRDRVNGGGITYGAISWVQGWLRLDDALKAVDRQSAESAGSFDKFTLDIARVQRIDDNVSLFARFSGQLAADNLDSSEDFGVGGPGGVRAYPVGEGYGDEGWLGQLELRYAMGVFTPFLFGDSGKVRLARYPWAAADNHRSIAGWGLGSRVEYGAWQAEASVAWRSAGGVPQADSRDSVPVAWFVGQYRF